VTLLLGLHAWGSSPRDHGYVSLSLDYYRRQSPHHTGGCFCIPSSPRFAHSNRRYGFQPPLQRSTGHPSSAEPPPIRGNRTSAVATRARSRSLGTKGGTAFPLYRFRADHPEGGSVFLRQPTVRQSQGVPPTATKVRTFPRKPAVVGSAGRGLFPRPGHTRELWRGVESSCLGDDRSCGRKAGDRCRLRTWNRGPTGASVIGVAFSPDQLPGAASGRQIGS
jgi:hypothetical protein